MRHTLILLVLLFSSVLVSAQETTVMSPGLAGERDKNGRNPELFVTRVIGSDNVTLRVDAHVPNKEYQQYPIQFDFYVNRQFMTSQIRSQELPGPIGVTIGHDIATPPFNYAVVAKVLHPTRSTHSMVAGAAFNNELSSTINCTLEYLEESYSAAVSFQQASDTQTGFSAEFTNSAAKNITVSGTVNLASGSASSDLSVLDAGETTTYATTGEAEVTDSTLKSLNLAAADLTLDCE